MTLYDSITIIITLAVFVSYVNYRFLKMQPAIAIMATSLIISIVLVVSDKLGFHVIHHDVTRFVDQLHFHDLLMNCMLGLLLFAGSLTVDFRRLKKQKWEICALATISVIASTFLIGAGTYYLLKIFGVHAGLIYCFLFGSLISPTDPIAVLATFKQSKVSAKLEMLVTAESYLMMGLGWCCLLFFIMLLFLVSRFFLCQLRHYFYKKLLVASLLVCC